MKYKVLQHNASGALEEAIIDTDESYTRLTAHAHIHSAEPLAKEAAKKASKLETGTEEPKVEETQEAEEGALSEAEEETEKEIKNAKPKK